MVFIVGQVDLKVGQVNFAELLARGQVLQKCICQPLNSRKCSRIAGLWIYATRIMFNSRKCSRIAGLWIYATRIMFNSRKCSRIAGLWIYATRIMFNSRKCSRIAGLWIYATRIMFNSRKCSRIAGLWIYAIWGEGGLHVLPSGIFNIFFGTPLKNDEILPVLLWCSTYPGIQDDKWFSTNK